MKIAILSCFYPYRGGISQFNACIYEELRKKHDVKAFNFKRQYPELLFPGKTQYVTDDDVAAKIESERILDTANPLSYPIAAKKIRSWGPDLLIMRYWMSYFAPSLGYTARKAGKGCKKIAILDNVIPHEQHFFDKPLTKYFLDGCDGYVTLCDAVGHDLTGIKPDARYITTPHPLYSHFGEKMDRNDAEDLLGIGHGKKNILFFGLIREYKGLDILIDAIEQCYSVGVGNLCLSICGKGSFWDECQQHIKTPKLYNLQIRFIKNEEIPDLMTSHHFLVLPYRDVTNSGPMMIGLNYKLPLIAPNIGCFKDVYSGETGFLYEQGQLSEALKEVAHLKEDTYLSMKRACEDLYKHYTEEAIAQKYLTIFKRLIQFDKK